MKNLFLIALFSVSIMSGALAQEVWKTVGQVKNGKAVLSVDKEIVLDKYNKNLKRIAGIEGNFTDVKIVTHADNSYALVFVGRTYVSSFFVKNMGNGVLAALASTTCTTSECSGEAKGCIPKSGGGCTPCANGGTCTKSSSDASLF